MSTTTGKAARRKYGNRYACKRMKSHRTSPEKQIRWQEMEAERLKHRNERIARRYDH